MTAIQAIPRLLSAREAADRLGVSTHTIHRLVAAGALRSVRLTPRGPLRFTVDDVIAAIEAGRST